MRSLTLVAALVVATSSPLAAQEAPVEPGARVRVTAPDLGINKYTGVLEGVVGDTLAVDTLRLPLASVTRFEVHRGRKSNVGRGALFGAGAGLAAGAIWGATVDCRDIALGEGACVALGAGLGAVGGALLGLITGAAIKTDRWEAVPLDRIRVSLTPLGNGGFGVVASVRVP